MVLAKQAATLHTHEQKTMQPIPAVLPSNSSPALSVLVCECVFCAQDPRIERIACTHKGTYADDCLCDRVRQHKCYIVATCDKDLRRRIRKVNEPFLS